LKNSYRRLKYFANFGGINLEDIKAPESFEIERRLVEELNIPVMHDDQPSFLQQHY
jgi:malic enzyme